MLKNLTLKYYKSYKDLSIDFDKITTIYGLSSSGKTNILSALKLACTAKPNGNKYISNFAKDKSASIKLNFEDGNIEFKRNKTQAKYILNDDKENPFTHLNKNVPDEIQNFLKIDIDNFSNQFDGPYLIFSPNSAISKKINEIIGIEKWDIKLKEINKVILDSKNKIKEKYQSVKEKRKLLVEIENIGYLDLEKLIEENDLLKEKISKKTDIIEKIIDIKKYKNIPDIKNKINRINKLIVKHDELKNSIDKKRKIIENINKINEINKEKKIFSIILKLNEKLIKLNEKYGQSKEKVENKTNIINKINNLKNTMNEIKSMNKELKTLTNELKGKICPECGQEIKI